MHRLKNYIITNFSSLFLSIFLPLFTVASMILFINISTYTAVIQLTVTDMLKLYLFNLPHILFFTLPVTFFTAAALTLFRLSTDNEMVVLFSLGIKPNFLLKTLLKPAIFLSLTLFVNFYLLFPHTLSLSSNFISYKKSEAKFNLSASEFGNSFGDWLLYLGKKNKDDSFSKVFLFNKNEKEEILIAAQRATVVNDSGVLKLKLFIGEGYSYSKEKFTQVNFETMIINDTMKTRVSKYEKSFEYWFEHPEKNSHREMFITNFLLSLFPVLSLYIIASIGIIHARHGKSQIYLYIFLSILTFYGLSIVLQKILYYYTILVVIVAYTSVGYYFYRKNILSRF